jgi:C-terminal processing protease CtpA/Prc
VETIKIVKEDKKKEFTTQLANLILTNLKPAGRSALYTMQDKEKLGNRVENINPQTDLYETLGIEKNASPEKLEEAYKNKVAEVESQTELEQVKYAYEVLSDSAQKQRYDKAGVEPTVFASLIRPNILHLYIKKISPTTLDELKQKTEKFDNTAGLNAMILDLRANVGGSIDVLPYLLGPFIGNDRYAYNFFHQGEKTPFKTKIGWLPSLVRYKKLVILIDDKTQSSAEIMASTLKKYNVGVLVGTKTKGWGTIESVINIDHQIDEQEKYAIFLVHSLTLNEDDQPMEGQGVSPAIQIIDSDWKNQLFAYFHYEELAKAVEEIWNKSPESI